MSYTGPDLATGDGQYPIEGKVVKTEHRQPATRCGGAGPPGSGFGTRVLESPRLFPFSGLPTLNF